MVTTTRKITFSPLAKRGHGIRIPIVLRRAHAHSVPSYPHHYDRCGGTTADGHSRKVLTGRPTSSVTPAGRPRLRLTRLAGYFDDPLEPAVRAVLERIDAIEALAIATIDVSPAYWRTLGNRLAARLSLPEYTAERHAAWLAGRALP